MGLLITIEANDGSGKETQSKRLLQRLLAEGYRAKGVSFPNYASPSSALLRMYLQGEFGENADDVSPYTASVLFAVDRYASYQKDWRDFYNSGGIVIADRYTTANMIHQSIKYDNTAQRDAFLDWLSDFEYRIMGIPKPNMTFFLDVPVDHSIAVIDKRANKIDGSSVKDIHERDHSHLRRAYQAALKVGQRYGWQRIICTENGQFKPIEDIHQAIYSIVKPQLPTRG